MAAVQSRRRSAGRMLLAFPALCLLRWSEMPSFVQGPPSMTRHPLRNQQVLKRASAVAPAGGSDPVPAQPAKKEVSSEDSKTKDIDDAVLRMAMAMSEEEAAAGGAAKAPEPQEEGFDFNNVVTVFWVILIVYSFGSSIIGITQGRIQDRTGGDFTLYDFFDNIFVFSEWNLEYTLGFDPFKLFDNLTKGGNTPTA
eukprot:TRINITY_DN42942_c0_g1_i1.p1 TRINITY_DN42942_c0_g1~~TRINITY_DN42942_c0_g1_i1.p1  ORF type:complete len:222 (-),score=50.41 TRINITY_DN42942_c0_g1_i1:56-643(-)